MPTVIPKTGATLFDVPISNGTVPPEGPKAVGVVAPFGTGAPETTFTFNALLTQTQAFMKTIQAVFVDNSLNGQPVTISPRAIPNYKVEVPANNQAYLPLLVGPKDEIDISSTGGVDVPLVFVNVPLPAAVWAV